VLGSVDDLTQMVLAWSRKDGAVEGRAAG
jgi:hypothetical protein